MYVYIRLGERGYQMLCLYSCSSWGWARQGPKHVEDSNVTYMLLLNCALKLVQEIIIYYDARSKKHQITQIVSIFTNFKTKCHVKCGSMCFQTLWIATNLKSAATDPHTLRTRTAWKYTYQLMTTSTACLVCGAKTSWEASLLSGLAVDSVMNKMKFHLFDTLYPSLY